MMNLSNPVKSNLVKRLSAGFIAAALFISGQAFALNLQEAKAQGLIGEMSSGYVGAVKANAETNRIVADINAKRKAEYQGIAQRNGAPLQAVEQLAGQKAINKTPAGQFINVGGGWKKK